MTDYHMRDDNMISLSCSEGEWSLSVVSFVEEGIVVHPEAPEAGILGVIVADGQSKVCADASEDWVEGGNEEVAVDLVEKDIPGSVHDVFPEDSVQPQVNGNKVVLDPGWDGWVLVWVGDR